MTFLTPRQRFLAALVAVLVAAAAATSLSGHQGWSLAVLAVLLGAGCVLLLDVRHRQQVAARAGRRLEAEVTALGDSFSRDLREVRELRGLIEQNATAIAELATETSERHSHTTRALAHLDYEPVNEIQALLQLLPKVPGAPPLPGVGGWALAPSALLALWDVIERERPATVLECGSGTSTVWLAYAARAVGGVRVVALEHKAGFARQTRELLAVHGLDDVAEVRHAPLQAVEVEGRRYRWYDLEQVTGVDDVELLVVDGPPKSVGAMARFPALPLLHGLLRPRAAVVVDDAQRPDEIEAVARWQRRHGVELERRLGRDAVLLRTSAS